MINCILTVNYKKNEKDFFIFMYRYSVHERFYLVFGLEQISRHYTVSLNRVPLPSRCTQKYKTITSVACLQKIIINLIWAYDCNIHSVNAETDPNLFQPHLVEVNYTRKIAKTF